MKTSAFILAFLLFLPPLAKGQNATTLSAGNPLEFIPNQGQVADMKGNPKPDILYKTTAENTTLYLRNNGISYVAQQVIKSKKTDSSTLKLWRVDMDYVGCQDASTENSLPTEGYLNYYYPQCPNGITHIKGYNHVLYRNLYKNIDVAYSGNSKQGLKYDIIVNPGGNVADLKMKFTGAKNIELQNGILSIYTDFGKSSEYIPNIYQESNGNKQSIQGHYEILNRGNGSVTVSIKVNNYNPALPLVIDPWWSTYYGGNTGEGGQGAAIDNLNNVLITGETNSPNFPVSVGAFQSSFAGGYDVFVVKLNQNGGRIWATYYGGGGSDNGEGIAADASNNVYVTGNTQSSNFPVSVGAFQSVNNATGFAAGNAFLIKFDLNGVRQWGTYFGGDGNTLATGIATDPNSNNVAFVGSTSSFTTPVSPGCFQSVFGGGGYDAYCAEFDPSGNRVWATLCGGSADDRGFSVVIDKFSHVCFTGNTVSTNFPITPGAFQLTNAGGGATGDVYIEQFSSAGAQLWGTYYGGSADDKGNSIAVDGNNNLVVTGSTYSANFPITPGTYQNTYLNAPNLSAFVIKFTNSGSRVWGTYNNSASENGSIGIAVDEMNDIYTVDDDEEYSGYHVSPVIITSCAFRVKYDSNQYNALDPEDQYVTKFDPTGNYVCSTYVGGDGEDEVESTYTKAIAVKGGRLCLTGSSTGRFPVTPGAFMVNAPNNSQNAFIISLCAFACGDTLPPLNFSDTAKGVGCAKSMSFYASVCDMEDTVGVGYSWSFPGATPSSGNGKIVNNIVYPVNGTYTVTLKLTGCTVDSITKSAVVSGGFGATVSITNPTCIKKGKAMVNPVGGTPPYTYNWSNANTNQTDTGLVAGNYTCVVTDGGGCKDTLRMTLTGPASPTITIVPTSDTICNGSSVSLKASGGKTYTWLPTGGLSCNNCPNPMASPTITTTYTVTGTDSLGCTGTATAIITVTAPPAVNVNAVPDSICKGSQSLLTATGASSYTWVPASSLSCNNCPNPTATPTITTTYTVVGKSGNCTDTVKKTITVLPPPVVSASANPDTICSGKSTNLLATGAVSYTWTPSSGLSCTNCPNPTATVTGTTTYTVVGKSAAGCTSSSTVTINIEAKPTISGNLKICSGQPGVLTASGNGTYLWSDGETTNSILIFPSSTTTYSVIVNSAGCIDTLYQKVNVNPTPSGDACCDTTIVSGDAVTITATGGGTYTWYPNQNLSCDTCPNPTANPTQTTRYYVTVTSDSGCVFRDSLLISVKTELCGQVFVPNAFSPNGDAHNDVLYVRGNCFKSLTFEVFDRWGNKVFETSDVNTGWNGNYKGLPMNTGTYAYYVYGILNDGTRISKKGDIALVR